jgi:hypothetical protein
VFAARGYALHPESGLYPRPAFADQRELASDGDDFTEGTTLEIRAIVRLIPQAMLRRSRLSAHPGCRTGRSCTFIAMAPPFPPAV